MSIHAEFFEHSNYAGISSVFNVTTWPRYHWIKFGPLSNRVSSFRANVYDANAMSLYALTERELNGRFAALHLSNGWSGWFNYVGDSLNDDIESTLVVNRDADERLIPLKDNIEPVFSAQLDRQIAGTQLHKEGGARVYGTFFPGYDSNKTFVTIEQRLFVVLSDFWSDYAASVRYDIHFYLTADGHLDGYAAWSHVWVEKGVFSQRVHDAIAPGLHNAKATLTQAIRDKLAQFGGYKFRDVYLLPGSTPPQNTTTTGDARSDVVLALAGGTLG